jgi:hypothetical protein
MQLPDSSLRYSNGSDGRQDTILEKPAMKTAALVLLSLLISVGLSGCSDGVHDSVQDSWTLENRGMDTPMRTLNDPDAPGRGRSGMDAGRGGGGSRHDPFEGMSSGPTAPFPERGMTLESVAGSLQAQ